MMSKTLANKDMSNNIYALLISLTRIVLGFEILVVFLGGLTLFGLAAFEPRYLALIISLLVLILLFLAISLVKRNLNISLFITWFIQLLIISAGFFEPIIFVVGLLFLALWVYCFYKGKAQANILKKTLKEGK